MGEVIDLRAVRWQKLLARYPFPEWALRKLSSEATSAWLEYERDNPKASVDDFMAGYIDAVARRMGL